jgi:hypothetical protein
MLLASATILRYIVFNLLNSFKSLFVSTQGACVSASANMQIYCVTFLHADTVDCLSFYPSTHFTHERDTLRMQHKSFSAVKD